MSARVRAYVAKHSKLIGSAKNVLLQIAHYADDDGNAFPSVGTLAKDTGYSESTIHRALRAARQQRELEVTVGSGPAGTNVYRIKLENIGTTADREAARIVTPGGVIGLTPPVNLAPKGSLRGEQYSSSRFHTQTLRKAEPKPTQSAPNREPKAAPTKEDHGRLTEKNGYLTCPDCGRYGGRCECGDYLNDSFDAAMKETLDAGKPGPAQIASEATLRGAYQNWTPYKIILADSHRGGDRQRESAFSRT